MSRRAIAVVVAFIGAAIAAGCADDGPPPTDGAPDGPVSVLVDATAPLQPISPLIRGISGDWTAEEMAAAGIRLGSWGGNPSTRFNYRLGNAWNSGADWEYRNTDYGWADGDPFGDFVATNEQAGAETRLAVPALGWVAKNADSSTCSFPAPDGGCGTPDGGCDGDGPVADPRATSEPSTPTGVGEWVASLLRAGLDVRFVAIDNEPELWGYTHYDVHPECTTYDEVLDTYVAYAEAVRAAAPRAELLGPVMCCWYDFWNPKGAPDGDFLGWFLATLNSIDRESGGRTIDVVDVHYYPQSDVFNDDTDAETNARRLRATRSLWDPGYVDESWIDEPIRLIPRLHETIDHSYPGLPLAITEWNFGADGTVNGALAIADVLAIFGRQGVYAAAYWRSPEPASPGYFAFALHGNYDGEGSAFEGMALDAESTDPSFVSSYAAIDRADNVLRVMLINKDPHRAFDVDVQIPGVQVGREFRRFSYGALDPTGIVGDTATTDQVLSVPAYTIEVLEFTLR